MTTIDKICKEEANSFAMFDPDVVKGLCKRGLIYFDVPVYPDDRLKGLFYMFMFCSMSFLIGCEHFKSYFVTLLMLQMHIFIGIWK